MDSFIFSINAVLPLFLLVILGFILRQTNFVTDEWLKMANGFSFKVTLSTLLFYDTYSADSSNKINGTLILYAVGGVILISILSYLIVPLFIKDNFRKGVVIQGLFRSNFLLFGMPLMLNMFGDNARPLAATMVAIIIPVFNLIAVITLTIFSGDDKKKVSVVNILKGIITNPLLVGCAIGYIFKGFNVILPEFIDTTISWIARIGTPLALIILGGQFKIKGFLKNIKVVTTVVIFKLIIIPVILIMSAIYLGFRGIELGLLITIFGSPGAVSGSIMAYSMGCDGELAGQIVVAGTFVSVFTMFITIFIVNSIGLL